MGTVLHLALVLHITGFVLLGGTTLMSFIISRQLWNYLQTDLTKAITINAATLNFERITRIGAVLTSLSGILMAIILWPVVSKQPWFRIKMVLVILIILNSIFFARPQMGRINKILAAHPNSAEWSYVKSRMNSYYTLQLLMLFTIFVLSAFRF